MAGQPRLISWEELVPKDWDPAKAFKGIDLGKLDDADPRAAELLMKLQEASNNAPTNPAMNKPHHKPTEPSCRPVAPW